MQIYLPQNAQNYLPQMRRLFFSIKLSETIL
jgi:hypothetical protein